MTLQLFAEAWDEKEKVWKFLAPKESHECEVSRLDAATTALKDLRNLGADGNRHFIHDLRKETMNFADRCLCNCTSIIDIPHLGLPVYSDPNWKHRLGTPLAHLKQYGWYRFSDFNDKGLGFFTLFAAREHAPDPDDSLACLGSFPIHRIDQEVSVGATDSSFMSMGMKSILHSATTYPHPLGDSKLEFGWALKVHGYTTAEEILQHCQKQGLSTVPKRKYALVDAVKMNQWIWLDRDYSNLDEAFEEITKGETIHEIDSSYEVDKVIESDRKQFIDSLNYHNPEWHDNLEARVRTEGKKHTIYSKTKNEEIRKFVNELIINFRQYGLANVRIHIVKEYYVYN